MPRKAPSPWWLFGGLAILFLTFRVTGAISMPWWLVLSPLWLPIAGGAAVFLAILVGCLIQR